LLPIVGWLLVGYCVKNSGVYVWSPNQAAATTLEWLGQWFCFISKETCREFEK
jgi:hypothetical protein